MPVKRTYTASNLDALAKSIAALPPAPAAERVYDRDEAMAYIKAALGAAYRKGVAVKAIAALLHEHGLKVGTARIVALTKEVGQPGPAQPKPRARKATPAVAEEPAAKDRSAASVAPSPDAAPSRLGRFTPTQDRPDV